MSDPIRIDAHQHFWDIESGRYTWPTPEDGAIYRTYSPADLEPELRPAGIDFTVLAQTVNTLEDTDLMLANADCHGFIGAVIGWVPLADARATEAAHHERDPAWLLRREVGEGLNVLARRGLAFDVVAVFPDHLRLVPSLAGQHPDLAIVVDHLAKPPFRSAGWSRWHDELRNAAASPNVFAKLSGLDTAAGPGWTPAEIAPAVEAAIEAFGPDRLMAASDWPVCESVSTYGEVMAAVEATVLRLAPAERDAILGGTAARIYGIGDVAADRQSGRLDVR